MKSHMRACLQAEAGTSWLRLLRSTAGDTSSIPGWGPKILACHVVRQNKTKAGDIDFAETLEIFVIFHFKSKKCYLNDSVIHHPQNTCSHLPYVNIHFPCTQDNLINQVRETFFFFFFN